MFDVMAKPVHAAFVIDPEKLESFLNHKTDAELKRQVLERGRKLQEQMKRCENERNKVPVRYGSPFFQLSFLCFLQYLYHSIKGCLSRNCSAFT